MGESIRILINKGCISDTQIENQDSGYLFMEFWYGIASMNYTFDVRVNVACTRLSDKIKVITIISDKERREINL